MVPECFRDGSNAGLGDGVYHLCGARAKERPMLATGSSVWFVDR